jgi:hypothetical protein
MDKNSLAKLQKQEQQTIGDKHLQEQKVLKNALANKEANIRAQHEPRIRELQALLAKATLPLEIKSRELPLAKAQQAFEDAIASFKSQREYELKKLTEKQNIESRKLQEYHRVEPYVIDLLEQAVQAKHLQPTAQRDRAYILYRYEKNTLFGKKTVEETRYQERGQLPVPTTLKRDIVAQTWEWGGKIPGQCVLLFSVTLRDRGFDVSVVSDASWSTGSFNGGSIDSVWNMRGPKITTKNADRDALESAIVQVMAGVVETGPCDYSTDCSHCDCCSDACD